MSAVTLRFQAPYAVEPLTGACGLTASQASSVTTTVFTPESYRCLPDPLSCRCRGPTTVSSWIPMCR